MIALAVGLLLVPALDQALKLLVLRGLAAESVPLGALGKLQVIRSRAWWARPAARPDLVTAWGLWFSGAAGVAVLTALVPSCGGFAGALLGGSLSHALETSWRGCVIDYVRLRFWPPFNLADVAITAGAIGVLVQWGLAMRGGS